MHQSKVKKKGFILLSVLAVTAVLCVSVFLVRSYLESFVLENEKHVINQFTKQENRTGNVDELQVVEKLQKGNYIAYSLRNTKTKRYYLAVYERCRLWNNRYTYFGGTGDVEQGELGCFSYNRNGVTIKGVIGYELPDKAVAYSFYNDGIEYTCNIKEKSVLRIFEIVGTDDINGAPVMYDKNRKAL